MTVTGRLTYRPKLGLTKDSMEDAEVILGSPDDWTKADILNVLGRVYRRAKQLEKEGEAALRELDQHYPTIAGQVLRLQQAHEDRAATEWEGVAMGWYNATRALRGLNMPIQVPDPGAATSASPWRSPLVGDRCRTKTGQERRITHRRNTLGASVPFGSTIVYSLNGHSGHSGDHECGLEAWTEWCRKAVKNGGQYYRP